MALIVAEDRFGRSADDFASILCRHFPELRPPRQTADAPTATVAVNNGRWVARCPFCRGAEVAYRGDMRFLCGSCFNMTVGGAWILAPWPADAAEIERLLLLRSDARNRCWEPHESVDDLTAENVENGVAV